MITLTPDEQAVRYYLISQARRAGRPDAALALQRIYDIAQHAPVAQQCERALADIQRECKTALAPASPQAACVTYMELADAVDPKRHHSWSVYPRFNGIGPLLSHVSTYEAEHGRPLLSALAIRAGEPRPGDGFWDMARAAGHEIPDSKTAERRFWLAEVEHVVRYWSAGPDAVELADAPYTAVMAELAEIKRMLRKVAYS